MCISTYMRARRSRAPVTTNAGYHIYHNDSIDIWDYDVIRGCTTNSRHSPKNHLLSERRQVRVGCTIGKGRHNITLVLPIHVARSGEEGGSEGRAMGGRRVEGDAQSAHKETHRKRDERQLERVPSRCSYQRWIGGKGIRKRR
jgi:hypothetical protein